MERTDMELELAWCVLHLAATAKMPDSYWTTDKRTMLAASVLGWDVEEAREVAQAAVTAGESVKESFDSLAAHGQFFQTGAEPC